jgi:G:T-mismatch repair DNA endonuclease (very short patch repair protein)
MTDTVSPAVRSRIMRSIRPRDNGTTEIRLAHMLGAAGILGWRRNARISGSFPDFAFPLHRLAISARLGRSGWRVVRIWEHELDDAGRTVGRITSAMGIAILSGRMVNRRPVP